MKKFGFTLAEILIALSIIGIMATLVGPAISNLAPDKNKVIYIDYFNKLGHTIQKMLADSSVYYVELERHETLGYYKPEKCIGLACDSEAKKIGYGEKSGKSKLPYLIAKEWGLDTNDCDFGDDGSTLKTSDGVTFVFKPTVDKITVTEEDKTYESYLNEDNLGEYSTLTYRIEITLPDGGRECIYGVSEGGSVCTKPRKYVYNIDTYGNVTPGDPLSKAYMQNQYKMNNKQKDYDCAAKLLEGQACTD